VENRRLEGQSFQLKVVQRLKKKKIKKYNIQSPLLVIHDQYHFQSDQLSENK